MDILEARVIADGDKRHLELKIEAKALRIPMTEDLPKEIKETFNQLILRLKSGPITFKFEGASDDLFSQVASEYIAQLNKELAAIYTELTQNELLARPAE